MDSIHLVVGGPQGGGLDTVMRVIARLAARLGYSLIADREYYSNIKGRHSYIHIKISTETARSLTYPVDLFVSMDAESIFHHFLDVREGGYLVYNTFIGGKSLGSIKSMRRYTMERIRRTMAKVGIKGDTVDDVIEWVSENRAVNIIGLNYEEIVRRLTKRGIPYPQASRLISTLVSTVVTYVLGFNIDELRSVIRDVFRGMPEVIRANILMVDEVMEILTSIFKEPPLKLDEPSNSFDEVLVVTGNEVVAMGKIVGGLRFQSYYPITPAADESFYMEGKEVIKTSRGDTGNVVVIQTEDEIAAITSAIGAALAGVRAATSTSGPGFSLMVEALGWAGINEVPVVITYYQRGGPSTGLPTRGSQSDLLFTLFAGHGEFPRIVIASGDHEEAFMDAITSLNLAEKYQVPVIHLLDKFLANTIVTMPIPDLRRLRIERGLVASEGDEPFKRFNLKYLVSPRPFLGQGPITYYTGDEHDEVGHITEDPELRIKMYSKRMSKLELMDQEI
ncbi:MAG: 2-oxoacid:acceptor oxidoreductase subunit alpha, partial [Thermoprotei archaeon]